MVLIFNLTISDVFFSVFLITLMFLERRKKGLPSEGDANKKARYLFKVLAYRFSSSMALLIHVAIACDRLHCVLRPIKYWQYKKRKYMILTSISIWVVASLIAMVYLVFRLSQKKLTKFESQLEYYSSFTTPLVIGLVILIIYVLIILTYRKNTNSNTKNNSNNNNNNNNIEGQGETGATSANDICRKKQEKSLLKMCLAIVCGFYLCWVPACCETLLHKEFGYKFNQNISNVFALMTICNTILNSMLYFPKTRRLVFGLLSKLFCCCTRN